MIKGQRKSIEWYSSENPKPFSEFYTDMFLEDLRVSFMPIGGVARRRNFSVRLVPENTELEGTLIAGLARGHHEDSLSAAVSELFRLVASEVCAMDRAIYEVVPLQGEHENRVVGFELAYINPVTVELERGRVRQRVPREVADRRECPENISFDQSELIIFEPPKALRAPLTTARHVLSRLSELSLSPFVNEAVRAKLPYDYKVHRAAMEIAFARAMKDIGWIARSLFQEGKLSYYTAYMHLVFERFKLRLRETFLAQLNSALSNVGQLMNFSSRIEITGLPTNEEIDAALAELKSGRNAFTAIMEPFLQY
jgi:hypothetical protein